MTTCTPIAIVGIGNILLHDEGVGVRVIEHLRELSLPTTVELIDGGTAGADLVDVFADRKLIIVIDAVSGDYPPGTVLRMTPEETVQGDTTALSLHEVGVVETLEMTRQLGCQPDHIVIFGIKPKDLFCGIGLSSEIEQLIPRIADLVIEEIGVFTS